MTYKGIWGKLQKWNERSSTCRCLCNKLGCEEMHVQHGQEASIVSGTTSPDHKWDDRSQNSTGQERCRVSVYFALLSYTKLSKKFSKAIFFQLGQENWLREFWVDPIWSNPLVFSRHFFEVWRAKTQWAGSPRKVPPATVFLGEERLASLTGGMLTNKDMFFSRCFNKRQPNMERTYSDLREKILGDLTRYGWVNQGDVNLILRLRTSAF